MQLLPAIITALVLLGMLAVHELGHFIAAKLVQIPIARVSLGFGPTLVALRRGGTEYRIAWLPLGGYVVPALEEYEFAELPAGRRLAFLLGGPTANLVAAFGALWVMGIVQYGLGGSGAVPYAWTTLVNTAREIAHAIGSLYAGPVDVNGVIWLVAWGSEHLRVSTAAVLRLSVFVNMNLALLNLLPLPPLDGGRIVFVLLGKLWRPIARIEWPATMLGCAVVLAAVGYTMIHDLLRLAMPGAR